MKIINFLKCINNFWFLNNDKIVLGRVWDIYKYLGGLVFWYVFI